MAYARFLILGAGLAVTVLASQAVAQSHVHPTTTVATPSSDSAAIAAMADHAMMGNAAGVNMAKHMALTPTRSPTTADSARARQVVADLKRVIGNYADTAVAVADGYKMFLPNVKTQKVYHFTNYARGFKEAFRFDPEQPTSLLYVRRDGKLQLIGAMYTMPKRASIDKLNARIPLSIAHWHKHVNWCLPKLGDQARLTERDSAGLPKFGPESPVATKAACNAIGGRFFESPLGWMVHVNALAGDDLATIFGDDHGAEHAHGRRG